MIGLITREDIPCWFKLSWIAQKPAILLGIHQDVIEGIESIPPDAPIVEYFRKEFKLGDFINDLQKGFGFERALVFESKNGAFINLRLTLPVFRQKTENACPDCNGSGKDSFGGHKCAFCGGSGKEHLDNWQAMFVTSASLSILFEGLAFPEKETSATFPQLLTVQTTTQHGFHGGSLGGRYSKALIHWLGSLGVGVEISEMVQAMQVAHKHMMGVSMMSRSEELEFRARVDYKGGWLNVSCPGNACGLNPAHGGAEEGRGYEWECHNVDSPVQQLTLLAGLAALCDKARSEMGLQ